MEDSTDLTGIKNLWLTAEVAGLPTAEEAVKLIKHYRFKMIVKKAAAISALLPVTISMLYAAFYGSKMLTTIIGEAGFFTGVFILLVSNANSLKRAVLQTSRSNREFIEYLKQAERGRIFFYEKVQPIAFLIMSLGLFSIVYELVYTNLFLMSAAYSLLAIYVAVMWFIVRPRITGKRLEQLKATIEKLETAAK